MFDLRNYINDVEFRVNLYKDKVHIVNYTKIVTIEKSRISIGYSSGMLIIKGKDLALKKLLDDEILIKGIINSVELE
ncbi:MAG: YabP/YqfC family sporulation protein [Bacilli bacterium]|nr:YabP/YqfC family sporulation protein [Clostridium sp.]MDY6014960.1 YabP/YqfC family sporulation protein [Bacilli bacterium]